MDKKALKKIISGRLSKIERFGNKIRKHCKDEDIHQIRVEVKKLRAFLRLVAVDLPDPEQLKIPGTLRKVYATCGKIRDTQLHIKRVEAQLQQDQQPDSMYIEQLQETIRKNKKKLDQLLSHKFIPSVSKKINRRLPGRFSPDSASRFVQEKVALLKIYIASKPAADEDLHTIRKNLKDLMYDMNAAEAEIRNAFPAYLVNNGQISTIKALEDQLGEFNDLSVAVMSLEPGLLHKINEAERLELDRIRQRWQLQKEEQKKAAINLLSGFYPVMATAFTENQNNNHTP